MKKDHALALFLLAGFKVTQVYQLENQYWPNSPSYADIRKESPWWLVKTEHGLIQIGWRKRVISIDWSDTGHQVKATEDEVTKEPTLVHAYSYAKAVEYLTTIRREIERNVESAASRLATEATGVA